MRPSTTLIGLSIILLVLCLCALTTGSFALDWQQAWHLPNSDAYFVLWELRIPRVLAALFTGAALSLAGCLLQSLFNNPLVEPSLMGISSGALLGLTLFYCLSLPLSLGTLGFAWIGAMLVCVTVLALHKAFGGQQVSTLLLIAIAVTALCAALVNFILLSSNSTTMKALQFFANGHLEGLTLSSIMPLITCVIIALAMSFYIHPSLDSLALGVDKAQTLGIQTQKLSWLLIIISALLTAVSVTATGMIAFVGLVGPHIARLLVGTSHRYLLLAAALVGAGLVVIADLAAKLCTSGQPIPAGIFTSLIGAPFFLHLLHRQQKGL